MVAPRRRRRRGNPVVPRSTLRVAGNPVVTTVTARPGVVRRWVHTTLWRHRRQRLYSGDGRGLTVGLGVQWTPPFRKLPAGAEPPPGTLQLCAGNHCLVFKIARAGDGAVPRILRRFLADARVTFAAFNVASDCRKLRAHHGLDVASTLELRSAGDGLGNASMAEMASRLLGIPRGRVEKPPWIATSEWDGRRLSRGQVRYAAMDAYLSCRLGERIRRRRRVDDDDDDEYESSDGDESVESSEPETASDDDDDDGGGDYCPWTDRLVGFIGACCVQDEDDRDGLDENENLPYQTPAFVV